MYWCKSPCGGFLHLASIIKVSKQGYNTEYKTVSIKDNESQNNADDIILRPKS